MSAGAVVRYAFWDYDHYPFVLSGVVGYEREHHNKQFVYIPAYQGFIRPFAILEGDAGKALSDDLENLGKARRKRDAEVATLFRLRLNQRLGESGLKHPNLFVQHDKETASRLFDEQRKQKAVRHG